MNYISSNKPTINTSSDCICLPIFSDKCLTKSAQLFDEATDQLISKHIERYDICGDPGKTFVIPIDNKTYTRIILLGLGKAEELSIGNITKACKSLANTINNTNIKKLTIDYGHASFEETKYLNIVEETICAFENQNYRFDHYKSKKIPQSKLEQITFQYSNENPETLINTCNLAQARAVGIKVAKDLGNQPGNICTPNYLAQQASMLAKRKNFSIKILEESDMEALNMGAFLSVSKGSTEPGKLIVIEYTGGTKDTPPHMLVGKGITFDSGGISLKAGASMDEMKYDMCGAASVLGTMNAIAELNPKVNIVSLIAAAENMPAGNASKPGDIVTSASGQTIEILNTDAEGRLVLCDSLTYAEQYKPASVIDIATLTGACIVALGHCTSALMGNDQELIQALLDSGIEANDKAWQLPIGEDYQGQLDSPFADMQNIGGKGAGSITAACFLSKFAEKYKWAHLDIAGTAWTSGGKEKGATGRPVPLLLNYLLKQAEK